MSKAKKFTQEELDRINVVREEYDKKIGEIGVANVELMLTEKRVSELHDFIEKLKSEYLQCQQQETTLVEELNKKYGSGTIDLLSGEFTPTE
tara:strand:+ start:942 stop:1217 length:276 start_codon:yes stop_codon:yes gene_type:complete